jgi:hypothetical protein
MSVWMSVSCECCVLSATGLCVGLITHTNESYRVWCVWVCLKRPWPRMRGWRVMKKSPNVMQLFSLLFTDTINWRNFIATVTHKWVWDICGIILRRLKRILEENSVQISLVDYKFYMVRPEIESVRPLWETEDEAPKLLQRRKLRYKNLICFCITIYNIHTARWKL